MTREDKPIFLYPTSAGGGPNATIGGNDWSVFMNGRSRHTIVVSAVVSNWWTNSD